MRKFLNIRPSFYMVKLQRSFAKFRLTSICRSMYTAATMKPLIAGKILSSLTFNLFFVHLNSKLWIIIFWQEERCIQIWFWSQASVCSNTLNTVALNVGTVYVWLTEYSNAYQDSLLFKREFQGKKNYIPNIQLCIFIHYSRNTPI